MGDIFNSPRHRSTVIERPTKRCETVAAHSTIGGLEPDDAAEGRGVTNRTGRIFAERAQAESTGYRSTGTGTGSAGDVFRVPWIPRHRQLGVRQTAHVKLAHQNGPGFPQLSHRTGISHSFGVLP